MSEKKQSFFNLGLGTDPTKDGKIKASSKKIGCIACGLYKLCNSPRIAPVGNGKKGILIVTEYPGNSEDNKNTIFTKKAKRLLIETLDEIDINLEEDCWCVHAVRCKPQEGPPSPIEINYCRNKLLKTVTDLNPKVIITMGKISLNTLIGERISGRLTGTKMEKFFGECIPDQELEKWICPTYSVEWLLTQKMTYKRKDTIDPVLLRYWKHNVKVACTRTKSFFKHNFANDIFTTIKAKEAIAWLNKALENRKLCTFDYESTGLKPHRKGHTLSTCSFSDGLFGYAFPYFSEDPLFCKAWYRFTRSKHVKKVAHNLGYENTWTKYRATGKYVQGWDWDTCLASHCVHNLKPTNQKFYVYVYLGVLNYDGSVDKFLKPTAKEKKKYGANAINNISKADLGKVLLYNGQDSHFCYKIMEVQRAKLTGKFLTGYRFFQDGAIALSKIQNEGLYCNMKLLNKNERILTHKIDRAWENIQESKEFKKWKNKIPFNPNSDTQLSKMLYDILKYPKPKKGEKATDKQQLTRIGTSFTKALIPYREMLKMRDTYLAQFKREQVGGIIRPFFNLNIPITFRSSSNGPNFQNMPARDPVALKYVMSCIVPRLGNKLIEWDYKGVEVATGCCYHKDPTMIKYLVEGGDMHTDTAADITLKKTKNVTADERQELGKGGFVFPSFYGSGVATMAPVLWEKITTVSKFINTKRHLYNVGIRTYKDFYRHMEEVMKIFWEERFPVYMDWKRKTYHDYLKKGYVDLYTGFRYHGPATFTQITNAQIQGSAFHILLWSLTNIHPVIKANFDKSFIIGQIHDAIVGDIAPADEPEIDSVIKLYGTQKVREHWDWIILPFRLEKDSTEVDGSWNTMKGRGFI